MKNLFKQFKNGFTLAEVLITLVIIGVIAALTIPTVINKTNKQEYVSKLKKTYSTLAQATNKIIAEDGLSQNWVTTPEDVYNKYKKYLSITKDCGTDANCIAKNGVIYTFLNGNTYNFDTSSNGYRRLILSDGTIVIFEHAGMTASNCNINYVGSTEVCTFFSVDINGSKKPNVFGKDLFAFVVKNNGLYPAGCDTGTCPNSNGHDCACKVLREGAINY